MIRIILLFIPFIFLFAKSDNQSYVLNLALQKHLYKMPVFKSLLFYKDKFYINDNKFYLSSNRDLKSELIADIKGFFEKKDKFKNINNHPQCKFPARFMFIKKELNLSNSIFPKINCPALTEYKQKAPAKNIYMVFASANIKSPSSMMGHTFFKFEGTYKNQKTSHAISFYTFINTINPFKLIYENIASGMKGIFGLSPYKDVLYNYLENENRNIWEYKLNLTSYQKKFIFYHIWELKDIKMKYYFTSFNCSTVDLFIISIINPSILNDYKYYITPLDLMKLINKHKLIKKTKLMPSDEWFIKLTEAQLNLKTIYKIKNVVENNNIKELSTFHNFYAKLLIKLYALYLFKQHKISKKNLNNINKHINLNHKNIDISKYKNPLKSPYQRQIGISYFKDYDKKNYLSLNFLPASHTLSDDNREYFNESELKLANIKILLNQDRFLIENFDIYTITNLLPFDILLKPISYDFSLNLKRDYNKKLNKNLFFNTKIGLGEDFQLQKDMNLFFLLNTKLRINNKDTQFLIVPTIGSTIYTIGNGKIYFEYSKNYTINSFIYDKYLFSYNLYFKNLKFYSNYSLIKNNKKVKEFEFGIERYF